LGDDHRTSRIDDNESALSVKSQHLDERSCPQCPLDTFVLFGGATLVLFYGSQRHSGDIDLLPDCDESPNAEKIIDSISPVLGEVAQALGLAPLAISVIADSEYLLKIKVEFKDQRTLFTIDISRTSAVIKSELVEQSILTDNAIVKYPTRNLLLLH
jgi:hypothetical protein